MTWPTIRATCDYLLARLDIDPHRDEGLTTTEIAVLTFLLVGAAVVVAGIIFQTAQDSAEQIPEPQAP